MYSSFLFGEWGVCLVLNKPGSITRFADFWMHEIISHFKSNAFARSECKY